MTQPSDASERPRLPWPLTRLVGRVDELSALERLLAESRLVTLVGAPGVGKSRLATEVAVRRRDQRSRESAIVALADVTEDEDAPAVVLAALDISTDGTGPDLAERDQLVLLDDASQVRRPIGTLVTSLLERAPGLRVLVTSRTPLGIPGEHVVGLGPLPIEDAMTLFRQRAREAGASDPGEGPDVAEICRRLDHLPLALEVAASWTRTLAPRDVLERLESTVSSNEVMADTVASCLALVEPDARRLFARLSVLVGAFDLDALEAVGATGATGLALLATLVDHSLVQAHVEPSTGRMRYRLLAPLRQRAAVLLNPADRDDARRRHAEHYLEVARRGDVRLRSNQTGLALHALWLDEGNLLAAGAWLRQHDVRGALSMAVALARYWEHRGQVSDARLRLEHALHAAGADAAAHERSVALARLGRLAWRQRRYADARASYLAAMELADRLGDRRAVARGWRNLALVDVVDGRPDDARTALGHSIEGFRHQADRVGEAWAHTVLALVHFEAGDPAGGSRCNATALELSGPDRPDALTVHAHLGLAYGAWTRQDLAGHRRHLGVALTRLAASGPALADPDWLWAACTLAADEGRAKAALRLEGAMRALGRAGSQSVETVSVTCERALRGAHEQLGPRACRRFAGQGARAGVTELMAEALAAPGPADRPLTRRELEVVELVGRGLNNEEIGNALHISRRTVESHVEHCRRKLDLTSRFELVTWTVERRVGREIAGSG